MSKITWQLPDNKKVGIGTSSACFLPSNMHILGVHFKYFQKFNVQI